ncbi:MAG: hypothetical protein QNJ97_18315 [Myxococcota bacterium]|nr:hypothetical protein [Myxococcota bacterium]
MILVDVEVKPRVLAFRHLTKGVAGSKDFSISVREPDKINITSVSIEDPRFKLEKKSDASTDDAQYVLSFNGSDTLGRISSYVRVAYTGSDVPHVDVPVRVNILGNLRYPKSIYFSKRDGQFKPRDIIITTRSGKPVTIKAVKDPDGKLKTTINTAKGERVVVAAEVADPDTAYDRPSRHKLTILTTDKDEPELSINYTITDKTGSDKRTRVGRPLPIPPPQPSASATSPQKEGANQPSGNAPSPSEVKHE